MVNFSMYVFIRTQDLCFLMFIFQYKIGGYYLVYGTSLGFTILGLIYIYFIPETVTKREPTNEKHKEHCWYKCTRPVIEGYTSLTKSRPRGLHKLLQAVLFIMVFCRLGDTYFIDQLYTQKKFGWTVTDFTTFLR